MQSIEQVIRATAEEFRHCPGWTKLLADALTELYTTRRNMQPRRSQMNLPTPNSEPTTAHTLESLNERLLGLESFVLDWMKKVAKLQAETLATASDSNKVARQLLDRLKSQQEQQQQEHVMHGSKIQ